MAPIASASSAVTLPTTMPSTCDAADQTPFTNSRSDAGVTRSSAAIFASSLSSRSFKSWCSKLRACLPGLSP